LTESGSLNGSKVICMPIFDREWELNGSKAICMPVFNREWESKRQQSYLYFCIWQRVVAYTAATIYLCLYLTENGSLNDSKVICIPVFDREWEFKRPQSYMHACIWQKVGAETAAKWYVCLYFTESGSLNVSKVICMPIFDREWELKRQQSYMHACIWQKVGVKRQQSDMCAWIWQRMGV
jgi:predicted  nucleic acid-binding Zn ribbon protein